MRTSTRTNQSREQHLARAAALAGLTAALAAPGLFFTPEIVLASTFIRTDAAATVVWTLWSLPVVCLGAACAASLLAGARAARATDSRNTLAGPAHESASTTRSNVRRSSARLEPTTLNGPDPSLRRRPVQCGEASPLCSSSVERPRKRLAL